MKHAAEQMKIAAEQMKDHAWGMIPSSGWNRETSLLKETAGAWNMDFSLAMAQPYNDEKHGRSADAETDRDYERGQRAIDRQRWDEARAACVCVPDERRYHDPAVDERVAKGKLG